MARVGSSFCGWPRTCWVSLSCRHSGEHAPNSREPHHARPHAATVPARRALARPSYVDDQVTLYEGDTVQLLPLFPRRSIDALVTDPPYGLSFNGHSWDDATGFRESLPHIDTSAMTAPEVFEAWCTAWATAHCMR